MQRHSSSSYGDIDRHARAAARAAATIPCEYRVWKVSRALDNLSVLCEQHRRHVQHVDGAPEWSVPPPSVPAGRATERHTEAPAFFAWDASGATEEEIDTTSRHAPARGYDDEERVDAEMAADGDAVIAPRTEIQRELRGTARELMAQLSVAPTPSVNEVESVVEDVAMRDERTPSSSPSSSPPQQAVASEHWHGRINRPRAVTTHSSPRPRHQPSSRSSQWVVPVVGLSRSPPSSPSPSPPSSSRSASTEHRRHKHRIRNSDAPWTYPRREPTQRLAARRDDRSEFHSSSISSGSASAPRTATAPLTTYQATFQWPGREFLMSPTSRSKSWDIRNGRHRVVTADEAVAVARRTARDDFAGQWSLSAYNDIEHQSVVTQGTPEARVSQPVASGSSTSTHMPVSEDVAPGVLPTRDASAMASPQLSADALASPNDLDSVTSTPEVSRMSVSTNRHVNFEPVGHHDEGCSIVSREEERETPTGIGLPVEPNAVSPSVSGSYRRRVVAPARSPSQFNPILMNPRYPAEPRVFRGKTTYSTEYGGKTHFAVIQVSATNGFADVLHTPQKFAQQHVQLFEFANSERMDTVATLLCSPAEQQQPPGKKPHALVRVHPRYVRLRQGSEIRYHLKLLRPPTKSKALTIHVCVVTNKCGITAEPTQIVITASDWRHPREIRVTAELDADVRTIQIYHKIHENYDDVYGSSTIIPSVSVSVLQKEATFLFAFGCGRHGRLGLGLASSKHSRPTTPTTINRSTASTSSVDALASAVSTANIAAANAAAAAEEPNAEVPTPFACKWLHPVQIACGKAHSAIIDVYSNIYCFGCNENGQLGQGDGNLEPSKIPLRVPSVGTANVLHVACGVAHTLCLTVDGKVFSWGDNACGQLGLSKSSTKPQSSPTRVEKAVNVRTVFAGGNQSFLVTVDNNVLACGSNVAGQLGLGDRLDRDTFCRSPFFRQLAASTTFGGDGMLSSASFVLSAAEREREKQQQRQLTLRSVPMGDLELACGPYHTLAIKCKRLYAWGNGDDGRLGHGSSETVLAPRPVEFFSDIPVKLIACGGSHSGALGINGDVYTWGNNQYGQLGSGSTKNRRVPAKIRLLQLKGVTQLSFGEWHSLALCDDGALYAWGFGEEGQLGLADDVKQMMTRVVPLPTVVSALSGTGATMVRCGSAHSFVVSVLESRRPQLAARHRHASRLEVMKETERLARQERRASSIRSHAQKVASQESRNSTCHGDEKEDQLIYRVTKSAPPSKAKQKRGPNARQGSRSASRAKVELWQSVDTDDTNEVVHCEQRASSWKERPMTSRASVRNALRQEFRVMTELKEVLSPRSAPLSSARQSSSRSGAAFVSPRLRRLHEQVVRASHAGIADARTQAFVGGEAARREIESAVLAATAPVLCEQGNIAMSTVDHAQRLPQSHCHSPRRANTGSFPFISNHSSDEEDEVAVGGMTHTTNALETAIRWPSPIAREEHEEEGERDDE